MNASLTKESAQPLQRVEEFIAPEVNIFEKVEGYVLEAEMPGVNKEGLEITLEGSEITITGHRPVVAAPAKPSCGNAIRLTSAETLSWIR